jgi:hypothetical protein
MMMTNGVGAWLGSTISSFLIGKYYVDADGSRNWEGIWFAFACYAFIVAVLFLVLFRHKHDPNAVKEIAH